jgi:hypothetical protein
MLQPFYLRIRQAAAQKNVLLFFCEKEILHFAALRSE